MMPVAAIFLFFGDFGFIFFDACALVVQIWVFFLFLLIGFDELVALGFIWFDFFLIDEVVAACVLPPPSMASFLGIFGDFGFNFLIPKCHARNWGFFFLIEFDRL